MKQWEIWMEGFAVTGQQQGAQLINNGEDDRPGLIWAETFDDAVRKYMELVPDHGIEENGRNRYSSDKAYQNRESNWNIWACSLYPTEGQARKSFG